MLRIVYKDKNSIVIIKPIGMPSQPDPSEDLDAMTATSSILKEEGERSELWLVHRLDRTVSGLMAFARTKSAAARMSSEISDGKLKKEYYAVADGQTSCGEMRDFLFKDASQSKAFVIDGKRKGAKLAALEYTTLDVKQTDKGIKSLVKIDLKTGRFHQIRVQFASRAWPLTGDGKYGSRDKERRTPALFSCSLSFPSVNGGRRITATPELSEYPWSLFDNEKYI